MPRPHSLLDNILNEAGHALRTILSPAQTAAPNPAAHITDTVTLNEKQQKHSAGLMRVDHTGEICAQALYRGQALVARDDTTHDHLMHCAEEEQAHLAWCEDRLKQLDAHTSLLNPFWYGASFCIGAVAGLAGDRWSYGFVVETERQVEKHLQDHLTELPEQDKPSHAILSQMLRDEACHADEALKRGGKPLPKPIKAIMKLQSRVMTKTAYHL